jgi:hypothetical protein
MSTVSISEIHNDAWNLWHLLAMLDDQMLEMPHDRDGDRPCAMDRISAVVRIARDACQTLCLNVDVAVNAEAKASKVAATE